MGKKFRLVYEKDGVIRGSYSGIATDNDVELIERAVLEGSKPAPAPTPGPGPKPTGTIKITENGLVDVAEYAKADVDVPGEVPTGEIDITTNGVIEVAGYATANVQVPQPSGKAPTIEANGTDINIKDYESVDVAVRQPSGKKPEAITANGEGIDVTWYETVDVNVPQPSGKMPNAITENGTNIDVTDYEYVDVDVAGSGDPTEADDTNTDSAFISGYGGQYYARYVANSDDTRRKVKDVIYYGYNSSSSTADTYGIKTIGSNSKYKVISSGAFSSLYKRKRVEIESGLGFGWVISPTIESIEKGGLYGLAGVVYIPSTLDGTDYFVAPNDASGGVPYTIRSQFTYNGGSTHNTLRTICVYQKDGYDGIGIVSNISSQDYVVFAFKNDTMSAEIICLKDHEIPESTITYNGNTYTVTGWYRDLVFNSYSNILISTFSRGGGENKSLPSWLCERAGELSPEYAPNNPLRYVLNTHYKSSILNTQDDKILINAMGSAYTNDPAFTVTTNTSWSSPWINTTRSSNSFFKLAKSDAGSSEVSLSQYPYTKFSIPQIKIKLDDSITKISNYAFPRNWCVPPMFLYDSAEWTGAVNTDINMIESGARDILENYFYSLASTDLSIWIKDRQKTYFEVPNTIQGYNYTTSGYYYKNAKVELEISANSQLKEVDARAFNLVKLRNYWSSTDEIELELCTQAYGIRDNESEACLCHYYVNSIEEAAKLDWHSLPKFVLYVNGVAKTYSELQDITFDFNDFTDTSVVTIEDIIDHGLPIGILRNASTGNFYPDKWNTVTDVTFDIYTSCSDIDSLSSDLYNFSIIGLPGVSLSEFVDYYQCWNHCPLKNTDQTIALSDETIQVGDTSVMPEYPQSGSGSGSGSGY